MELNVPPEPREIKESIKKYRSVMSSIPTDIEYDSLAVWYNNKLSSYLWRHWKSVLESYGYTWQRFTKVIKHATEDIIEWALYDKLGWVELVKRLETLLERYSIVKR